MKASFVGYYDILLMLYIRMLITKISVAYQVVLVTKLGFNLRKQWLINQMKIWPLKKKIDSLFHLLSNLMETKKKLQVMDFRNRKKFILELTP